ncbi:MAG: 3'-5' exonuclease [Butyrivibrio sp.]|nr:3'-5' exonuclease [Butyrivibrio sp.]MBR1642485.1 3'-5' exonuclease [Butyrivibrio sp.]
MALASNLSENDRKELNRSLGLPVKDLTKKLKYYSKNNYKWNEYLVDDYEIIENLKPSGSNILKIYLENGLTINIHADYFSEMQKPSFLSSIEIEKEYLMEHIGEEFPKSYVVVDLETSGKNHKKDKIIEIGAIRFDKGKEIDRLSVLVNSNVHIPDDITNLTGITNEMLNNDGIEPRDAALQLRTFLEGSIVIGHNFKAFDKYFINDLYEECLKRPFNNECIDTLYLAREKYPILQSHSLEELATMFQIDYSKAHRAVEDCMINQLVYEYLAFGKLLNPISKTNDSEYDENMDDSDDIEQMVSLDENEFVGWKKDLNNTMKSIIIKQGLPDDSILLKGNLGRKEKKITSYSICIYEPELIEDTRDSSRNTVVLRIAPTSVNSDYLKIEPKKSDIINKLSIPSDAEVRRPQKSSSYIKINSLSENLQGILEECIYDAIDNYCSKESKFACCARYKECSQKGHCVHNNQLFSAACAYKHNLENGRNFFKKD